MLAWIIQNIYFRFINFRIYKLKENKISFVYKPLLRSNNIFVFEMVKNLWYP